MVNCGPLGVIQCSTAFLTAVDSRYTGGIRFGVNKAIPTILPQVGTVEVGLVLKPVPGHRTNQIRVEIRGRCFRNSEQTMEVSYADGEKTKECWMIS